MKRGFQFFFYYYFHYRRDLGVGIMNGTWIDHSIQWSLRHTIRTTSNYSVTANLNALQITAANINPSPACNMFNSRFLVTASNSGDYSAPRAQVLPVRLISRNWTLSIPPTVISRDPVNSLEPVWDPWANPTENTAFNKFSIVVIDCCVAISRTLLASLPTVTKQRMLLLVIVA
jgi:hypothetical protein